MYKIIYKVIIFIIFLSVSLIAQNDTLTTAFKNNPSNRDFQTNGPTPIRLWSVPEMNGIYACMMYQGTMGRGLRWNFFNFSTMTWVADTDGYEPGIPGGYGGMCVNYTSNFQYFPFFTAHNDTANYSPDIWYPDTPFDPNNFNGDYVVIPGPDSVAPWPLIGITSNGYLHLIATDYDSNYEILYSRCDFTNPVWDSLIHIVQTGDAPFYALYADPFGNTVVVTYCRSSSDNHIIMLIDTLAGDMFYAGNPITVDLDTLAENCVPLPNPTGFVGDGNPFVDRDRNIHYITFCSDGTNTIPVYVVHVFYNPRAETASCTIIDSVVDYYYLISINSLGAGRSQIGQVRENGHLYAVWEEFIQEPGRFVVSSTDDTLAPTRIKLAWSFNNGLTWNIDTLLESDNFWDNNEWLRFPVISPVLDSLYGYDRVIWGVYLDDDPGFVWQGQGDVSEVDMLVGIKYVYAGIEEFRKPVKNSRFSVSLNPAKNIVKFYYELPRKSHINIKVFDLSGRLIKKLDEGIRQKGFYTKVWNLKKDKIKSGIYFCTFENNTEKITRKLIITR
jgi:hypothetical protein